MSPPSEPPGEILSFGVSPVNYSDSDSDQQSPAYHSLYLSIFLSIRENFPSYQLSLYKS